MRKQYDFKIKGAKVFAACNEITRLSRFRRLHLPSYTEEQFIEASCADHIYNDHIDTYKQSLCLILPTYLHTAGDYVCFALCTDESEHATRDMIHFIRLHS
jgi:hypothetical protein